MPFSLVIWIYDEIRRYILRRYPGCKYHNINETSRFCFHDIAIVIRYCKGFAFLRLVLNSPANFTAIKIMTTKSNSPFYSCMLGCQALEQE